MLRVVCAQRDRSRREAESAATEASRLKEELRAAQAASRKLHADNLALYEKMKFFQTTVTSARSPSVASSIAFLRGAPDDPGTDVMLPHRPSAQMATYVAWRIIQVTW